MPGGLRVMEFLRRLRGAPANTAGLRAERKLISREVASWDRNALLGLAHHLIESRIARFVAYELVLNHRATFDSINLDEVEKLGGGIVHWGDVDSFGCLIAGPAWRGGRIPDLAVEIWSRSEDWCWRRAALVSTVPLNALSHGDSKRTLKICRMLIAGRHDLVVKALSWALRQLAKRDEESVRLFLSIHHDQLAARVVREANHKLHTGVKNPRRIVL